MPTPETLTALLKSAGLWAKKSLGQNFLLDDVALQKIVDAAELSGTEEVVEVGPGTGFLTEKLLSKARHVTAVELDAGLVEFLKKRFKEAKNLTLHHHDALNFRLDAVGLSDLGYTVVANIPYYITSPLLKHFLRATVRPSCMVLLVQKEVAEKVCGLAGSSLITVETAVFGKATKVIDVPARAFFPPPKVDSAVIHIKVYPKPYVTATEQRAFFRLVQFGYSQKRKQLINSLAAGLHTSSSQIAQALGKAAISPTARPQELTLDDWKRLKAVLE